MHVYQLDDKKTDQAFLKGEPVTGKAVLSSATQRPPEPGESILVLLSSGKKYKADVTKVSFFVLSEYQVGEIEFVRSSPYRK